MFQIGFLKKQYHDSCQRTVAYKPSCPAIDVVAHLACRLTKMPRMPLKRRCQYTGSKAGLCTHLFDGILRRQSELRRTRLKDLLSSSKEY